MFLSHLCFNSLPHHTGWAAIIELHTKSKNSGQNCHKVIITYMSYFNGIRGISVRVSMISVLSMI